MLRVQRTLWLRGLKENVSVVFMMVMFLIYGAGGAVALDMMMWSEIRSGHPEAIASALTVGLVAYLMMVVMVPAGENHLQPEDFIGHSISPRTLFRAHALTALMTSRGLTALLVTVITTVFISLAIPPMWIPLVLVMMALQLALVLASGELLGSVFATQKSRTSKERNVIISSLAVFAMLIIYNRVISQGTNQTELWPMGGVLQWTPLASAGGVIAGAVGGLWLEVVAQIVISVLALGLVCWAWQRSLARRLRAPLERSGTNEKDEIQADGASIFLRFVPKTPAGAIYSRAFRYFRRDPRLLNSMIGAPLIVTFFTYQSFTTDSDFQLYLALWMLSFLSCTIASNDFGFDGPACWMYIASGLRPRTIALARHWASMTIPTVMTLLYAVMAFFLARDKSIAVFVIPAGVLMLVVASALSQVASVFNAYPTAKPGTNPWQDKSGYSAGAFLTVFAAMFCCWIPLVPGVGLLAWAHHSGAVWASVSGWALMFILPAACWVLARHIAARHIDAHLLQIFAKVKSHV
ncbi:hypothetical protein [Corynebacterium epidermidicanis]|nr:hypothetical protein [Corynebacterium epidermidicanis]